MRRIVSPVLVLTALSSGTVLAGHGWLESFEEAERAAARQREPLLVHFHASWCGPCRQMQQRVFSSSLVQRALQTGLKAVKVDISERPDLKDRFGADTIPRDIAVYPDGSVATLCVGLVPLTSYLSILRHTAARGQSVAGTQMDDSELNRTEIPLSESESVRLLPDESADGEIIGLDGYCPVMLTRHGKWVKGETTRTARYRGVLYYLSSDRQRHEFLRNPARYAPRNLGCDPVVLFLEQRAVTGRIRYGAFFDGKLYLFRTEETRREFKRHPVRYTRIQHAMGSSELTGLSFH